MWSYLDGYQHEIMLALLDSDTPVYDVALSAENVEFAYARQRLDVRINNIISASGASHYKLFVSGEGNFRKEICPLYKANRKPSPKWREPLRKYLIEEWGAVECNGYEADDACGIHQGQDTIICGIDKDLLQIPGRHYQWPIVRKGEIVRPGRFWEVSEEQGWRALFTQALTGDVSDNIKGLHRVGAVKAAVALSEATTEEDMLDIVYKLYLKDCITNDDLQMEITRLQKNLDLLYIWRELGITYTTRREMNGI